MIVKKRNCVVLSCVLIFLSTCMPWGELDNPSDPESESYAHTYGVNYDGNGNTGGSVPIDSSNYEEGARVIVLENTGSLVKTGYTFVGWNMEADSSALDRLPGDTFLMVAADVTLYAKWMPQQGTYLGNGNLIKQIPDLMSDNDTGATYVGSSLWIAGHYGTLYEIQPSNGTVLSTITTPFVHGLMGLAHDGSNFWIANHHDGKIYEVDFSGAILSSFSTPNTDTGTERRVHGLAWDGNYIWHADSTLDMIFQFDRTGNILSQFPSPSTLPYGLAWDGTYLWHSDGGTKNIYKIDPASGAVLHSFPISAYPGSFSMAFEGTYLWLSGNTSNMIYQID